jgi:HlyD family secretion protein
MRSVKRSLKWTVPIAFLAIVVAYTVPRARGQAVREEPASSLGGALSAPGRIEGASETLEIGVATTGILAAVLAGEGDHVNAGGLLARIDCRDLAGDVAAAHARVNGAMQRREKLLRGGRPDERAEASAQLAAAIARLDKAEADARRATNLWEHQAISRAEYENAQKSQQVASAEADAARERSLIVAAEPLPDERGAIDAELAQIRGEAAAMDARLAKCDIRSPIDGVVLRQHKHLGESVTLSDSEPVFTVADVSRYRVRAEVDESDIARVRRGAQVYLTAPAFDETKIRARVVEVSRVMGRKQIQTGDPREKADRDVLDVLADVDETNAALVVGLRVTVVFPGPSADFE